MKIKVLGVIIALSICISAGAQQSGLQIKTSAPASIVSETRLGPAVGNGTYPFRAALDVKHNRLWVLNRTPQSVSALDLTTRRLVGIVHLDPPNVPPFEGWYNSDPYIFIGYDSATDRVLVCGNSDGWAGWAVSIDAALMKIAGVRTFKDRILYNWVVNSRRGELVVAGLGHGSGAGPAHSPFTVTTLNSKTLETRGEFATGKRVQAMAASGKSGALYTVEPSNPNPEAYSSGGPYSATRVYIRDCVTGKILSKSSDDCAYPRFLLADDRRNLLYLVYRSTQPRMISSAVNTVAVLKQGDLKRVRTIHYPDSDPYAPEGLVTWNHAVLDERGDRLVVDRDSGNLATLPITGPARATRYQLDGSLYSRYHLALVLPHTGEPVVLMDNSVRLLNSRTLRSEDPIPLGATVHDLFLDTKNHRLLAQVDRKVHEFLMLEGASERRLFKSYQAARMRLLAVDFDRELIYQVKNDGWGNAANLQTMDFSGKGARGGYSAVGEFSGLILTNGEDRSYRLLFPSFPESTNALPHRSIDVVVKGGVVYSTPVPQDSSLMPPSQLLNSNQSLYIVNCLNMTIYAASNLRAIRTLSLSWLSTDTKAQRLPGMFAVDAAGEFAYYADPVGRRIVKFSLTEGAFVDARQLSFPPEMPIMDDSTQRIYLVDNDGGRVVAIALF